MDLDEFPTAEQGLGAADECAACSRLTRHWQHGVCSYPLCNACLQQSLREVGEAQAGLVGSQGGGHGHS